MEGMRGGAFGRIPSGTPVGGSGGSPGGKRSSGNISE